MFSVNFFHSFLVMLANNCPVTSLLQPFFRLALPPLKSWNAPFFVRPTPAPLHLKAKRTHRHTQRRKKKNKRCDIMSCLETTKEKGKMRTEEIRIPQFVAWRVLAGSIAIPLELTDGEREFQPDKTVFLSTIILSAEDLPAVCWLTWGKKNPVLATTTNIFVKERLGTYVHRMKKSRKDISMFFLRKATCLWHKAVNCRNRNSKKSSKERLVITMKDMR